MAVWQAILLGLVQGITGIVPVSSSGHLNLLSRILGIQDSVSYMILIFLHLGTVLGVFYAFKNDIIRMLFAFFGIFRQLLENAVEWRKTFHDPENVRYKKVINSNYSKFTVLMLVSLGTAFVTALILRPMCNALSGSLLLNGMGFLFTALLLIVCSFTPSSLKGPKDTKISDALVIGLFVGFSAVPGISMLGMGIAAGYLCGLTRKFIIKYAYIMTIPVLLGGSVFEAGSVTAEGGSFQLLPCLAGMAVSAVIVLLLIGTVRKHITIRSCRLFAGYSICMGILSVILYLA
ncbi:MAG: undecaprenyl-diphosphate phosphatase [Lachnospiraceae bacterium]|nr:undecaprenyl-diphosphate phosphatase [Lachnospiraceae bacterium]